MSKFTKTIFLVLILALAGITSANAQRIYASELKADQTATGYDLSFTLNAPATSGEIILSPTDGSNTIVTISLAAMPIGRNTVSVDQSKVTPSVKYTWEVKVNGAAITTAANGDDWVKFTDETANPLLNFYTAHGLAIDNNLNSPYLGRMYISSNYKTGSAGNGRESTEQGIYILDAALSDVTGQGNTAWTGGVPWFSGSFMSPERVQVGSDGMVYIGDAAIGGVWMMNPGQYDGTYTQVFGGTPASGIYQNGDATVGSLVYGLCVSGAADDLQMVTCDRYYGTGSSSNPYNLIGGMYNILSYDLGKNIPWMSDPSGVILDAGAALNGGLSGAILNNSLLGNAAGGIDIISDEQGGFFIAQNRNHNTYDASGDNTSDAQNLPCLIHISYVPPMFGNPASYEMDFNSGDPQWGIMGFMNGSNQTGMVMKDGGSKLIFAHTSTCYQIYNVDYSAGAPVLTLTDSINAPQTVGSAYSMALDVAGNLFVLTTATTLGGYAPVTSEADNTFTTPAPSTQVLDFSGSGIITPKVAQLQVYPNPVQDVVHVNGIGIESVKVIDLTGRIVLNVPVDKSQTSIDVNLSGVPAGNYIVLVNNTPVKIEKK